MLENVFGVGYCKASCTTPTPETPEAPKTRSCEDIVVLLS